MHLIEWARRHAGEAPAPNALACRSRAVTAIEVHRQ
jgi:hypothetical protein